MKLYLHQTGGGSQRNQHETIGTTQPQSFGTFITNDWIIFDGPDRNANLIANAEGFISPAP
uniref:Dirigent protein n=1 Tax=Leersia perrieri TaxID=77586 RepID=A0A0D9XZE2_9ORYZ